jgi:hypothetical protein
MPEENKRERIASKVRKLLAIAQDDATGEAEMQNAMNFALKMMEAHHLSEEDLAHEPQDDYSKVDRAEFDRVRSFVGSKLYWWENILAGFVSKLVGVPVYVDKERQLVRSRAGIVRQPPTRASSVVFYGVAEDALIAAELYDDLRALIGVMATAKWGSMYRGDGAAYAQGFVTGLLSKLRESKRLGHSDTSSTTAMILVARRDDLIKYKERKAELWLAEQHGLRTRKGGSGRGRGTRTGSRDAYTEGRTDGQSADVQPRERRRKIT